MKYAETAKRLQEALDDLGINQQELADRSGVGKSSISHYNGSNTPSNITAGKLASVLRVNPAWLMGIDVPKKVGLPKEKAIHDAEFLSVFNSLDVRDQKVVIAMMETMLNRKGE